MPSYKKQIDGVVLDCTAEENAEIDARRSKIKDNKLADIKEIRLQKLIETDYLAMSDNTMSDEMKTYRQSMRDIPQNYSEDKYDELLARDSDGILTHSIWSKP
tara:strand:- start:351 stop:659 length:309 start_codon:yes stop_codon:yes gene_type:complete